MLKIILAIFGLVLGLLAILAAIMNWKFIFGASPPPKGVPPRVWAALGGVILVVLAILTFAGVFD